MDHKPKLSVIIPAHNAGKFLERCVNSIVLEKHQLNMEVLIIENGSSDNTAEVARTLEEKYDYVHLVYSETGVSNARNTGINKASGDWIFFLDADDFLPAGVVSVLEQDMADQSVDLYLYSYEKGDSIVSVSDGSGRRVYEGSEIENCRVMMLENPTRCMAVWGKLFKKDVILRHSLKFKKNLRLAEDSDYLIRYTMYCEKIVFCRDIMYHYSTEPASAMRTYDGRKTQEYVKSLLDTEKFIETDSERIQKAYKIYVLMHLNVIMVREVFYVGNPESFANKVRRMRNILNMEIFYKALTNLPVTACKSGRMLPILLLKCRMYGLCGLVYQMRARQNQKREQINADQGRGE